MWEALRALSTSIQKLDDVFGLFVILSEAKDPHLVPGKEVQIPRLRSG